MMRTLFAILVIAITAICGTAMAGTMTDNRDGHVYQTVQIGDQVWMAENMAIDVKGSYPPHGEDKNIEKYGRLYTWKSAKKVCTNGWHLPSKQEFEQLLGKVCGLDSKGKIKSKGCDEKLNNRGFSALPAGGRYYDGNFHYFGSIAFYWSSTPRGSINLASYLNVNSSLASMANDYVSLAFSVRCIKDSN